MSKKIKEKKKKKEDNYYIFDDARKMEDKVLIKRLFSYAKPYSTYFIFIIISVLISSFMMSFVNRLFGYIIDELSASDPSFSVARKYSIIILVFIVTATLITFFRGLVLGKLGQKILYNMRNEIFSHIESLSLSEIDKTPVGKFVTRVCNDTNSLSDFFTNVLINLVSQVTMLIYAVVIMFSINWKLTLIVFTILPILIVATIFFRKLSRSQYRKISFDRSKINSFLSENLSGMKITQIFNKEEAKLEEFDELSNRFMKNQDKAMYIFAIFRPFIYSMFFLSIIVVFYFGSNMISALFTVGDLYSFYLYLHNLFNPIQNIAQMYNVMQSAFASAEKIFTVLDMESSIVLKEDGIKADNFKGEIEFKNVWFKYEEEKWIIKDMSFHIKPGEVVSFVGPTGAGKTTILSLIGRYYDPQKGEILIDGINIKDYDIHSLRKNIGEMLQDVFLFTGTILENITLRNDDISLDEVKEASKYVNVDKFIERLPNKYDEIVKERGNNYSQGERQLLSFARTIVFKPKMIILDEATSNIDTETEVLIQENLEKIKAIGTTIMVAHRLSTIQHSDLIMFVDNGTIVEQGNHQELLKQKGRYYNLYTLQYD